MTIKTPHNFMYWIRGICNYCQKATDDKSSLCDFCYEHLVKPEYENYKGLATIKDTIYLENYGNVSKARYNEVGRRVLVKDANGKGKHQLHRLGENGKLQDKYPDIY